MSTLLTGLHVVDLAGEPAAMTGRLLADLGATVVRVEPPDGDPLRAAGPFLDTTDGPISLRHAAWSAGKTIAYFGTETAEFDDLLKRADVVIDTPGWPGAPNIDPRRAPHASWIRVTAFGLDGPRSAWRASDLGAMAASGNMFATGSPDRAPVRCSEPTAYAHTGAEAVFAVLSAVASGRPQIVDVAMQEVIQVANMAAAASMGLQGRRGQRVGAKIGRTREVWACQDGFVTFGLRGGPARVPSLQLIKKMLIEKGIESPAWTERDWAKWNPNETTDDEMREIETPLIELFQLYTMSELQDVAYEYNLMLAIVASPREVYGSAQLRHRQMFDRLGDIEGFPTRIALTTSPDADPPCIRAQDLPKTGKDPWWKARNGGKPSSETAGAWHGTRLLEFGSGAAGPIATRYFVEHGATVIKLESRSRPDFLRIYALGPNNPHGLEGSVMFNTLNVGKRSLSINLKHPDGAAIAKRLIDWADGVLENFAPKAMPGFGLSYQDLVGDKPDLVMVSSCINGQTGPHRNYPGFGAQGAALACFNYLTGWPDREPNGPYGTITDSLSPRFAASLLAAGLLYRERTGKGVHLDLSQVEAGLYCNAPALLEFANSGVMTPRMGNRSSRCAPHGVFPCKDEGAVGDRWIAIAVWNDEEWQRLASVIGIQDDNFRTSAERLENADETEAIVATWTATQTRAEAAEQLQNLGIEAVPVLDFCDLLEDPQLAHRKHYAQLEHPLLGATVYEHNGFRMSAAPSGYAAPSPTLGQHSRDVLSEALGLTVPELDGLEESGALE